MQGGHCFNTPVSISGVTHTSTLLDGLATTAGLAVGMSITGGDIGASAVIATIIDNVSLTMSVAATGSTTASRTFIGDIFKILLIKTTPTTGFDHTQTNVGTPGTGASSTSNVGTDEVSATGYTTGGFQLTNVGASLDTGVATISFSVNPSWTSATFSTVAAIIYNSSTRLGGTSPQNNRAVAVYDFGGTQTVAAGTLTLMLPANTGSSAILRIS